MWQPFKPNTIEKENTAYSGIGSRYMQIAEDLIHNKLHVNDFYNAGLQHFNHEQTQLKDCTFVP